MILAVNTAEELLQIVLGQDGRVAWAWQEACPGRMNEVMAPAVKALLDEHGLRPRDLTGVACVRGPGSFTGLRLGLAFCHGLNLGLNLPLAGLDYLPLLGAGAAGLGFAEIHVLTHSRRDRVYHQAFADPDLSPLSPPRDLPVAQAAALLAETAKRGRICALGGGLQRNQEAFAPLAGTVELLHPSHDNPSPQALLLASAKAEWSQDAVGALYLRGSDAEENLAAIAKTRGLSPDQAQAWLERAMAKGTAPS